MELKLFSYVLWHIVYMSELEDLSLKYTDREAFNYVARKLNETKRSRDQYIMNL